MTCPFAHDDGAYVIGALSPADRADFERHLPECQECTRAVGQLAGLPGLLGRVDASVVEHVEIDEPVPATLLPALTREVRRVRHRRVLLAVGTAAAAAVVATGVTVTVWQAQVDETAAPAAPGASASPTDPTPSVKPQEMEPLGDVPVRATVTLEQVAWGTRLGLDCTYDTESVTYELPPEVDYMLWVRGQDGRAERVGSWRSVDGQAMHMTAGTATDVEDLRSVEVRTADGLVVLRLRT